MVKERYSIFQLIPDRDKLNTGSQGFHKEKENQRMSKRNLHLEFLWLNQHNKYK
jgi:hypothetical protein